MNKDKKNNSFLIILIIIVAILLAITIVLLLSPDNKDNATTSGENISNKTVDEDIAYRNITYNGQEYIFNDDITTILFMGIDQREVVVADGYEGTGGRSDSLILLILSEEDKTVTLLNISRDTMTDVAVYDIFGEYYSTVKLQITMQYAYGDGAGKSCRLTRNAVSNLLYGIPIDYYLSMNMDGIGTVTDMLGGVTLEFQEDYTFIDTSYTKGMSVTLDGTMAEAFIRYRDTNETGSNDDRMDRQAIFMDALVKRLQSELSKNPMYYQSLYERAEDYIVMDLDGDTMKLLSECSLIEMDYKVPGETIIGDGHDEYIVDNEELKKLIVELFYILN